jgi:hypothetical protein
MKMGQKHAQNTMAIFDSSPIPRNTTNTGSSASRDRLRKNSRTGSNSFWNT